MSDTTDTASGAPAGGKKKSLNTMLLPELRQLAGGLGIKTAGLRKGDLVEAIRSAQGSGQGSGQGSRQSDGRKGGAPEKSPDKNADKNADKSSDGGSDRGSDRGSDKGSDRGLEKKQDDKGNQNQGAQNQQGQQNKGGDDDAGGSRRNRRRRGRDRGANQGGGSAGNQGGSSGGSGRGRGEPDLQILEDDVLAPCAGILDLLDNYAFVRTSGYLPGADDVYVSMSMVRRFGLRRGDAVTGQVRQPREGERKEKYNPLVKIDTVNGADLETAQARVEFGSLTPVHPDERLRLETTSTNLVGRIIDIAAPIGKGQRGLIVSPPEAGKTAVLQSIAGSITANNPEVHLMVVLLDERPEEVTDFERSVNGEVISSTLDRPPSDHTIVAELAIERAKRLVELGHDVVVLVDGITRLGRAYNHAIPATGRVLAGGVDSAALHPAKKFFGAARNIEDGGSLTILATAVVETGSATDEVILEEFADAGNAQIRLSRELAGRRLFPAIDAVASGTHREELLLSKEELAIVDKLRRVLSSLGEPQALELLLERLKKTHTNLEFLTQVQQTSPTQLGQRD